MFMLYLIPMLVSFLAMWMICGVLFTEAETPASALLKQYEQHIDRRQ